jgi:hypothetical protein
MFQAFRASGWRDLSLEIGTLALRFSREAHTTNGVIAKDDTLSPRPSARDATLLTATRLGTLENCAAVGDVVQAGSPFAVLQVLGDRIEQIAEQDLMVLEALCAPGDLLEFGASIAMVTYKS